MFMGLLRSWRSTFKTAWLRVFVRFLHEAANSWRKQSPSSVDTLSQTRLITPRVSDGDSHAAWSSSSSVPHQSNPVAYMQGETNPWQPQSQGREDNIGPYHPGSSKRRQCLTVILYDATQSPKHRWESVFLSSQPDKYLSSTSTTP